MPHPGRQKFRLITPISHGVSKGFAAAALVGLAFIAACTPSQVSIVCPAIVEVKDASRLTRFDGAGRDLTDVEIAASLRSQGVACEIDDDWLELDMAVQFNVTRGPANPDRLARLRYFVAILNAERVILAREEFGVEIELPGNRTRVSVIEELQPRMPVDGFEGGRRYIIYVGFILTPEEFAYNKANR
jgi:hypothetical protein